MENKRLNLIGTQPALAATFVWQQLPALEELSYF
jgi:hypothetical protein